MKESQINFKLQIRNPKLFRSFEFIYWKLPRWIRTEILRGLFVAPCSAKPRHFALIICYLYFGTCFCFSQQNEIDSLLNIIKKDKEDTSKLHDLNNLAWEYDYISSYDSAMLYANSAMQLSNVMLKATTDPAVKKTIQSGEAFTYNIIGLIYSDQGNYPEALKNHFASLRIRESLGSKIGEATSYNNIGNIYDAQGNYPDALKNYSACLKIMEAIDDKAGIASSYSNIGNVYAEQGNYSEALKNYFTCLRIKESLGDKAGQANPYNNIGNVYYFQSNYTEALKYFFVSLKIRESIGDKDGTADSYGNIGEVFFKQKKYKEAEDYLNKSKELSREIGYKENLRNAYNSLSELDSARGNFKDAYENYKQYILYRDSLINEDNTKKTVQLQMTYEFEKKEAAQKAETDKQSAVTAAENKRQKIVIWSVIAVLLLVIVFAGFIFRALRITRKQKQIIEEQKKKVEEKQKEILDSIHYAKRIQNALLPTEKYIERTFNRLKTKMPQ